MEFATTNQTGGGAFWFWAALGGDGGTYQEADCVHSGSTGINAAAHDAGNLINGAWFWVAPGMLEINGVEAIGGAMTVNIMVQTANGQDYGSIDSVTITATSGNIFPIGMPIPYAASGQIAP